MEIMPRTRTAAEIAEDLTKLQQIPQKEKVIVKIYLDNDWRERIQPILFRYGIPPGDMNRAMTEIEATFELKDDNS